MDGTKSMLRIGAVILAAGMSKRMGEPKILLNFHGKLLFLYSVECAINSALSPAVIVGGQHIQAIRKITQKLPIEVIENLQYKDGMSESIKLGIEAMRNQVDAVMFFLADQPFLSPVLVKTLLDSYIMNQPKGIRVVRPRYEGIPGHPVIIDSELFPEFLTLTGDEGGRTILKNRAKEVMFVDVENPLWGADIDTPEDLNKFKTLPQFLSEL